jgi:hypothetical protein
VGSGSSCWEMGSPRLGRKPLRGPRGHRCLLPSRTYRRPFIRLLPCLGPNLHHASTQKVPCVSLSYPGSRTRQLDVAPFVWVFWNN